MTTGRFGVGFATAAAVVASTACAPQGKVQPYMQQAGSVALSADNKELYVAEPDNGGLAIVATDAASGHTGFVKTGDRPERVILRGGSLFVSNRMSRTVTQINAATHTIVKQIGVGAEPMGMELSGDGKTLYVAQATSQSVVAVDVASGSVKWEAALNDEVHALTVLPNGRLYVPGYKSGTMHVLEAQQGTELHAFTFAQPAPPPPDPSNPAAPIPPAARVPTQVEDVHIASDGRVYMPHSQSAQSLVDPTMARPAVITSYYVRPAVVGDGPSVTPGFTTILPDTDHVLGPGDAIPAPIVTPIGTFAGPRAAVLDISGRFLYSVNFLSNNVTVVPTDHVVPTDLTALASQQASSTSPEVLLSVNVGRGPTGIAIAGDEKTAYVYNSFDHTVSVLKNEGGSSVVEDRKIDQITPQTLTLAQQHGRQLFNDATDERITAPGTGGLACASCHPGGREDGMTWHFAEGLRNTPVLVGKQIKKTAPYHWDGAFSDFGGIEHVLKDRMGGSGLTDADFNDMLEYLANEPSPDNPNRASDGTLTAQQQQGKALFEGKAGCVTCHSGEVFTDNKFYDVGSQFTTIPLNVLESRPVVTGEERSVVPPNTPSLLGIFSSGPYLHDGSATTLEARIADDRNGTHGHTTNLSADEKAALVAYLKAL